MKEINAKFVVCDPETEEEANKALNKAENLLAIGIVEGCDDLIALAEEALEGINDKSLTVGKLISCLHYKPFIKTLLIKLLRQL